MNEFRGGEDVTATKRLGGVTGRKIKPGDTGTVLGVRVKDNKIVVEWDNGVTCIASPDAITRQGVA